MLVIIIIFYILGTWWRKCS